MKRLILVRHAKSSWSNANMQDKERPLNDRGREAAPKIGKWLAGKGYQPDQVIASAATRCQETWAALADQLQPVSDVRFEDYLYLATPDEMLDVLKTATGEVVLLVGHMPGIGDLARELRRDPPPLHSIFSKYPTAGTTVMDFRIDDWAHLQVGTGIFQDFITPGDL
jgi:phosphohistidine phosphatase